MKILDHGYVRFVESWGFGDAKISEAGIIEAARQSTQGSFRGWESDYKLMKFLSDNRHDSPFEFAGMVIEIQAPIFVFREWHRHRTQSYNEMSARYSPLPDFNYVPTLERLMIGAGGNKQAGAVSNSLTLNVAYAEKFRSSLVRGYTQAETLYQEALAAGVPKELARTILPVGRYSRMRAVANLRNWIAFLSLRMDPAAQWEIRQYANAVAEITAEHFPKTWGLYVERKGKADKLNNFLFSLKEISEAENSTMADLQAALKAYGIK